MFSLSPSFFSLIRERERSSGKERVRREAGNSSGKTTEIGAESETTVLDFWDGKGLEMGESPFGFDGHEFVTGDLIRRQFEMSPRIQK